MSYRHGEVFRRKADIVDPGMFGALECVAPMPTVSEGINVRRHKCLGSMYNFYMYISRRSAWCVCGEWCVVLLHAWYSHFHNDCPFFSVKKNYIDTER